MREQSRNKHLDNAVAVTTFALERFGGNFRRGETIIAQLRVDLAAALLRTYGGEGQWPLAADYAAARQEAIAACAAVSVVNEPVGASQKGGPVAW